MPTIGIDGIRPFWCTSLISPQILFVSDMFYANVSPDPFESEPWMRGTLPRTSVNVRNVGRDKVGLGWLQSAFIKG